MDLALILPTFAGVGPVKIYSFVSAINLQMRLKLSYNRISYIKKDNIVAPNLELF